MTSFLTPEYVAADRLRISALRKQAASIRQAMNEVPPAPCSGCPASAECAAGNLACLDFARYAGMNKDLGDATVTNLRQPSRQWFDYVFHDKDTSDEQNNAIPAAITERHMLLSAAKESTLRVAP